MLQTLCKSKCTQKGQKMSIKSVIDWNMNVF